MFANGETDRYRVTPTPQPVPSTVPHFVTLSILSGWPAFQMLPPPLMKILLVEVSVRYRKKLATVLNPGKNRAG